jgi:hypothetical protein
MPQLVKGGKHVFGWTRIKPDGRIRVPDEAFEEYHFQSGEKIILMSGSRTSGGFSIIKRDALAASKIGRRIFHWMNHLNGPDSFTAAGQTPVRSGGRLISWMIMDEDKNIRLSDELITALELKFGHKLLVGRGSGLGPAFIAGGPIFEEALKHNNLSVCY